MIKVIGSPTLQKNIQAVKMRVNQANSVLKFLTFTHQSIDLQKIV